MRNRRAFSLYFTSEKSRGGKSKRREGIRIRSRMNGEREVDEIRARSMMDREKDRLTQIRCP